MGMLKIGGLVMGLALGSVEAFEDLKYSWSPYFSEENGGWSVKGFMNGMRCRNSYCDDKKVYYAPTSYCGSSTSTYYTPYFSEEGSGYQRCPSGFAVTQIQCKDDYCDNVRLRCEKFEKCQVGNEYYMTTSISEESSSPMRCKDTSDVFVGLKCNDQNCDKVQAYCSKLTYDGDYNQPEKPKEEEYVPPKEDKEPSWDYQPSPYFSEENGRSVYGIFHSMTCKDSYCDQKSMDYVPVTSCGKSESKYYTPIFSEEGNNYQVCRDGYIMTMVFCYDAYCDSMRLLCEKFEKCDLGKPYPLAKISDERSNNKATCTDKNDVFVGLKCYGSYCDEVQPYCAKVSYVGGDDKPKEEEGPKAPVWDFKPSPYFSEEDRSGSTHGLYHGMTCKKSYCDQKSMDYMPVTSSPCGRTISRHYTSMFSEEGKNYEMCRPGFVVTKVLCYGDYCDTMRLLCEKFEKCETGDSYALPKISEESPRNKATCKGENHVIVGLKCYDSYCDQVQVYCAPLNLPTTKPSPTICPPGRYYSEAGHSCILCPKNYYCPRHGMNEPIKCQQGYYTSNTGSVSCRRQYTLQDWINQYLRNLPKKPE